jgi:hypothetical protein
MTTQGSRWRSAIAGIGLFGAIVFAAAFVHSFLDPLAVESMARELVRVEVQARVEARLERLDDDALVGFARRAARKNAQGLATLERQVAEGVPQQVAAVVARMLDADCECRRKIAAQADAGFAGAIADLTRVDERLTAFIQAQYRDVAAALTREFRIFTGANAFVFGLLGLIAVIRRNAGIHLVLPAIILVGAAALVGYFYLFEQDWLRTILFGDYVGFAYFAYLGLAMAFLVDVALNRARATTTLINAALDAVGSAFFVVPC